ncbi:MAG: DUF45 domain-containing protein [Bryobacterales bacterium]|nr:DUF45 domain-containing protein [Bryobacterales bacterium]
MGKTDVPYAVRFSEKAKRTRLAVSADGQVEAVAPAGTAPETVEAFVARKRKWVVQSLETVRARPRVIGQPQRFASGAKLLYRGRRLMLRLSERQSRA